MCDDVKEEHDKPTDAQAKSNDEAKSYDKTKTILKSFNEKKQLAKP